VRVARQATAPDLLAEAVELVLGEAALEVGAGVDAGAPWPWKKTWSPASPSSLPLKKWLKPTS
jgi:hypothetical protein